VHSGIVRRLQEFGVPLVAVSLGTQENAKAWLAETGFAGELYVDTSTDGSVTGAAAATGSANYRSFRLKRGRQYTMGNERTVAKLAETAAKFPDTAPVIDGEDSIYIGDVLQIGGVFVAGPGNFCDYAARSQYAGDLIDIEALEVAATGKIAGAEYTYPTTQKWFETLNLNQRYTASLLQVALQRGARLARTQWRQAAALGTLASAALALRRKEYVKAALSIGALVLLIGSRPRAKQQPSLLEGLSYLTPKQLDKFVMERGLVDCPCPMVMDSIPMLAEVGEAGDVDTTIARRSYRQRGASWDVSEDELGAAPNIYQTMLCYVRSFLGKPHPAVGRPGPVCPFVPKSLQLDTIKLSMVRTAHLPTSELRATITKMLVDFAPQFIEMEPSKGRQRQYKTVVFVFPDIALADAVEVIDGAQLDSKPTYVSRGIMVGEFHAANNSAGLRNPNFFPLRTPHPCVAVRHMVPGDFVFMSLDGYSKDLQRKFLTSFLEIFESEDRQETRDARAKLDQLS